VNISISSIFKTGILLSALALLLGIFACTDVPQARQEPLITPPSAQPQGPDIKVLIGRERSFTVRVDGPCTVLDATEGRDSSAVLFKTDRGIGQQDVSWHRGTVSMKGIKGRAPEIIEITGEEKTGITVGGTAYYGSVLFHAGGTSLTAANILPVEQYLCGVVLGELGHRAPFEAMKAQAVAARNFVLYEYRVRKNRTYHVTRTTRSQVFTPQSTYPSQIREAVNATRGIVMMYDNKLFKAYYSSTCGGRTANIEDVWSCLPQVPLTSVTCDFCREAPYYEWKYTLTRGQLKRKLHDKGFRLDFIKRVYVPDKGRGTSGRARYIKIEVDKQHHHGTIVLDGIRFRAILNTHKEEDIGNIKSTWFRVGEQGNSIVFSGKGFGHGVGMCQKGSMGMARAGYTFRDILIHYYSGISFLRIY